MQCREFRPLLSEYSDGLLGYEAGERLAAHLDDCSACSMELDSIERACAALSDYAAHRTCGSATPDLWAGFSQRLAAQITCTAAADLIPAFQDGHLEAAQRVSLRAHLNACSGCATEVAHLSRAIMAVDAVSRTIPAVDLWPAFAARLEAEQSRTLAARLRSWWISLGALRPALLQPMPRAAFGLAAVALLALGVGRLAPSSQPSSSPVQPTTVAVNPPLTDPGNESAQPVRPPSTGVERPLTFSSEKPIGTGSARRYASVPSPTRRRPEQPVRRPRRDLLTEREVMASVLAGRSLPDSLPSANMEPDETVLLAGGFTAETPPGLMLTGAPLMTNPSPGGAGKEVMAEVVRAFEQLAQVEEAASQPFGVRLAGDTESGK